MSAGTALADSGIASELMIVMAGGMGSGLRINEAEINRVRGGRPVIAEVQSKIRHWLGTDQKTALDWGPGERLALRDLLGLFQTKLTAKQQALTDAGEIISREHATDQERKNAISTLDSRLRDIDAGKLSTGGGGGAGGWKIERIEPPRK